MSLGEYGFKNISTGAASDLKIKAIQQNKKTE